MTTSKCGFHRSLPLFAFLSFVHFFQRRSSLSVRRLRCLPVCLYLPLLSRPPPSGLVFCLPNTCRQHYARPQFLPPITPIHMVAGPSVKPLMAAPPIRPSFPASSLRPHAKYE